jgi:hypothetical protein
MSRVNAGAVSRSINALIDERNELRRELQRQKDGRDFEQGALRAAITQLAAVHAVVEHARKISPSERAVLYVADLERALGMDAPTPHKTGGNDTAAQPETGE